jgi:hypothetical protein
MKFKHYKGGEYDLVALAKDEATQEIMVVYRSDDGQTWSRPLSVFFANVAYCGATLKRFVCVPPAGFEFCCDSGCEHVMPYPKLFEFSREEHADGRVDSKTKPYWACHFCGEDVQLYESATGDVVELPENGEGEPISHFVPPTREQLAELVEGMEVSVDVSTGDHDAEHRIFGKITEAMDHPGAKHDVILLVQDGIERNFDEPAEDRVDLEALNRAGIVTGRVKVGAGVYSMTTQLGELAPAAPSVDLPPRVLDVLWQSAGVSSYHPDGDQADKLRAYGAAVATEALARRPV